MSPEKTKIPKPGKAVNANDLHRGLIDYFLETNENLDTTKAKRLASHALSLLGEALSFQFGPYYEFTSGEDSKEDRMRTYTIVPEAIKIVMEATSLKNKYGQKIPEKPLEAIKTVLAEITKR